MPLIRRSSAEDTRRSLPDLALVVSHDDNSITHLELPLHVAHANGQQARAALAQRVLGARVHEQPAAARLGVLQPQLEADTRVARV